MACRKAFGEPPNLRTDILNRYLPLWGRSHRPTCIISLGMIVGLVRQNALFMGGTENIVAFMIVWGVVFEYWGSPFNKRVCLGTLFFLFQ